MSASHHSKPFIETMPYSLLRPQVLACAAAIMIFCGVMAYWALFFRAPQPIPPHLPPPAALDATAAGTLFGAQAQGKHDNLKLLGILSFDPQHAVAVISVDDELPRLVLRDGIISGSTLLTEIRRHSIMVGHDNLQREIMLSPPLSPSAFVR